MMAMRIQIKATGIELTDAIRNYADKKLSALDKYFESGADPLISIEVGKTTRHHKSGNIFRAEVRISGGVADCYAVSEKEDLYAAIDEVKDEVGKELTTSKKKSLSLLKKGGAKIKSLIKRLI